MSNGKTALPTNFPVLERPDANGQVLLRAIRPPRTEFDAPTREAIALVKSYFAGTADDGNSSGKKSGGGSATPASSGGPTRSSKAARLRSGSIKPGKEGAKAAEAAKMIRQRGLSDEISKLTDRLNRAGLTETQRVLLSMEDVYGWCIVQALQGEHVKSADVTGLFDSVMRNIEDEPRSRLEGALVATVFARNKIDMDEDEYQRVLSLVHEEGITLAPNQPERQILEYQRRVAREAGLPAAIRKFGERNEIPAVRLTSTVVDAMVTHLQELQVQIDPDKIDDGEYDEYFALAFDAATRAPDGRSDPLSLARPQAAVSPWDFRVETFETAEEQGVAPENIRAAGALDYVFEIGERMGVLRLANSLVLRWASGMLDIVDSDVSSRLYRYWQVRDDRLSDEERAMLYRRVLAKGDGEVLSRMVINEDFPVLWHKLMSETAAYLEDTQDAARDAVVSKQPIYRATQELQYNLSEHMTGMAHMQVTDMYMQLKEAFALLSAQEIVDQLTAGRRKNVWTVVERLSKEEYGEAPNVAAARELAVQGNKVFQWIADFSPGAATATAFEEFMEAAEAWIIAAGSMPDGELGPPEDEEDEFGEEGFEGDEFGDDSGSSSDSEWDA